MSEDTRILSRKIAEFTGWKEEGGLWYYPNTHALPQDDAPDFAGGVDTCLAYLPDVVTYICLAWVKNQNKWVATIFKSTKSPAFTVYDDEPAMAICRAVEKIIDSDTTHSAIKEAKRILGHKDK